MGNTVQMVRPNQERPPEEEESIEDDESSTFACEICIEPMLSSSTNKFKNNNRCVHPFCTDCIMKYIQVKVDENVADVPCPSLNCEQLLDPLSSRPIVPTKLFEKWCDVLCESAVLGFDRSYCPNQNCSALILNECGGNVKRSKCPNCKRLFCFRCKIPWHTGYRCEEGGEMRNRNEVEFGLLVERNNWKRCPRCGHCIERFTGCRAIKCRLLSLPLSLYVMWDQLLLQVWKRV
ncbi:E3 ubiquitin-protein ligase RSL1-like isoform X2 [Cornus florida]|uniref:E3 ubiquitin-protein ligase RSL1-like isoform X2 n=1 Tax=Cornus florida TaxID=4283 RepID=UPI0028A15571|nr:E3 ubiquitin-protein ligase RSL1-like isoform X2 [Cornus florida]